ncbi:MAG: ATP-binding cassette domain-containing protein [Proteobacteria bacterium]|nr:ATP-binding cassette domain-containing protein [Pseudomonadota bacterium]
MLKSINLNVKEKEFLGIVGPNGGGKTTLLKIILGLLKPTSGAVETRGLMSYVPQQLIFEKYFPISVLDVVLMGLVDTLKYGIYHSKESADKALEALEKLRISNLSLKKFGELSGGQRQRVLIARAIINNPDILILDEPTANIDKSAQEKVLELLKKLNKTITILMVSHQFDFITSDVNRVICIDRKLHTHATKTVAGEKLMIIDHSNDNLKGDHV